MTVERYLSILQKHYVSWAFAWIKNLTRIPEELNLAWNYLKWAINFVAYVRVTAQQAALKDNVPILTVHDKKCVKGSAYKKDGAEEKTN